jgi:hypothetical protein
MQQCKSTGSKTSICFRYPEPSDPILSELKKLAGIDIAPDHTQLDKARIILGYVHELFSHNGYNQPSANDPITILKEAKSGKSFRCVEYSLIGVALLWAYGIPARTIGLKTRDVETRECGAGHVVVEFWDKDFDKWVMCDVQKGVIPQIKGRPLSALELGQAISQKVSIDFSPVQKSHAAKSNSPANEQSYTNWISEYLYFYDTPLETTFAVTDRRKQKIVMLVPLGVEPPKIFQNSFAMNLTPTYNAQDFYPRL